MNSKIKSERDLLQIIKTLKGPGNIIITYNGSFDVLHVGHVRSIQEAKKQGDVLIILLNSDKSIKSYKGPNRPIIPENERAEMLAALEPVDYIVLFDDINALRILDSIKPDIHCNGADWGENCIERATVEKNGGKIYILKWTKDHSTTNVIKKIVEVSTQPTIKAIFIDRDGTINDNGDGYTHKTEDLKFLPGVIEGLKRLSKSDYKIIIATNQSGIGRGYFSEAQMHELHDWMIYTLQAEGIRVDAVYYCPHHPEAGCECRKPEIGMLTKAVEDLGVSLNDSWMIGDGDKDVITGRKVNMKTIKIGNRMPTDLKLEPNFYAHDLNESADIILGINSK